MLHQRPCSLRCMRHSCHLGWLQVMMLSCGAARCLCRPAPQMHQRLPQAMAAVGALSLTCPMQALLPSQVPSGSALAKLRQQELDTLQGKGKEPSFEPKLWDRVYQVSHQVWQSESTRSAAPLPCRLDARSLQHQRLLAVQHH